MSLLTLDQIHQLKSFDTPTVSNAVEGLLARSPTEGYLGRSIRSFTPEFGVMAGYAVTVTIDNSTPERRADAKGVKAFYRALAQAPKPAVVVFQDVSSRPEHSCHFGDLVSLFCKRLGAVGMVTDGGFRDLAGIRAVGMPVFAKGVVASRGLYQWIDINVPVVLDGTAIQPGDLIHGDASGVITIPNAIAGRVVEAAQAVRAKEQSLSDLGNSDRFTLEALLEKFG